MTLKHSVRLVAALAASLLGVASARANADFLRPVTGTAFEPAAGSAGAPIHVLGYAQNNMAQPIIVEAGLGHWSGNQASFTVTLVGNGNNFKCTITLNPDGSGVPLTFPASTTANGLVSMRIDTTQSFPNGAFYSIACTIPAVSGRAAAIMGVTPDR